MQKLGSKSLAGAAKFGQKSIHVGAKFGAKTIVPAAAVASIVAPEFAIPLELGAMIAKPVFKGIQKATR
jgi:hypothetical protein